VTGKTGKGAFVHRETVCVGSGNGAIRRFTNYGFIILITGDELTADRVVQWWGAGVCRCYNKRGVSMDEKKYDNIEKDGH